MCIFCKKTEGVLHSCTTLELNETIGILAKEMQDSELLATLADGDLIAIKAKYQKHCMDGFRHGYRNIQRAHSAHAECTDDKFTESRVFVEIVSFIESNVVEGVCVFRLAELHRMFEHRLAALGCQKTINKTRLKIKPLMHYTNECQEQSDGKNFF